MIEQSSENVSTSATSAHAQSNGTEGSFAWLNNPEPTHDELKSLVIRS